MARGIYACALGSRFCSASMISKALTATFNAAASSAAATMRRRSPRARSRITFHRTDFLRAVPNQCPSNYATSANLLFYLVEPGGVEPPTS
jgi:hypothetical protein